MVHPQVAEEGDDLLVWKVAASILNKQRQNEDFKIFVVYLFCYYGDQGGMRWVGYVARVRETRNVYRFVVGIPERKE
jgi:hypothetical protein